MKKAHLHKQAALYDPYLDTLGGGEKHILSILKVLEDEGSEINLFWDQDLQKEIRSRFDLKFKNKLKFLPNIFKSKNTLKTLQTLKTFDYFFYVTDGSYFFSSASNNFVFCMVPDKNLYTQSLLNKLKTSNYQFITNSLFTQSWLKNWGIEAQIIYPYLNSDFINMDLSSLKKEKIILSVGRFYSHLHSKKQSILIDWFNKLQRENILFTKFKLIMAGGLKEEDKAFFNTLKSTIKGNPNIQLQPNLSYNQLVDLYKKSSYYVHMTGYGVDENKNPEQVEHLGVTPLEAMATGCLTFCVNAGGPKEIINNEKTGFLFDNEDELTKLISLILSDTHRQKIIKSNAKRYIENNFTYEVFRRRVEDVLFAA